MSLRDVPDPSKEEAPSLTEDTRIVMDWGPGRIKPPSRPTCSWQDRAAGPGDVECEESSFC